jgi:hypothetical protein
MELANLESPILNKRYTVVSPISIPLSTMGLSKQSSAFDIKRKNTSLKLNTPFLSIVYQPTERRPKVTKTYHLPSIKSTAKDLRPFCHGPTNKLDYCPRKSISNTNVGSSLIGFKNIFKGIYKKNEQVGNVIKRIRNDGSKDNVDIMDYHLDIVRIL